MLPDRYRIDDGRHLPEIVPDEDASTAAGAARFRASCSCGRMPAAAPGSRAQALAAHIDHARARLAPPRGPAWLPLGARIIVLLVLMVAVALGLYAAGLAVIARLDLTGLGDGLARVAAVGCGFAAAFTLMVAARHFIAPTSD